MARPRPFPRPVPRRKPAVRLAAAGGGEEPPDFEHFGLRPGTAVIVYLHTPKEKVWGLLLGVSTPGVTVRCLDLRTFDDWMRQEARGEDPHLGPATIFYPMGRIERIERDETIGPVMSLQDRFLRDVGRSVYEVMGVPRERD